MPYSNQAVVEAPLGLIFAFKVAEFIEIEVAELVIADGVEVVVDGVDDVVNDNVAP